MIRISDEVRIKVRADLDAGMSHRKIAERQGVGVGTVSTIRNEEARIEEKAHEQWDDKEGYLYSDSSRIKSIEELLERFDVDLTKWEPYWRKHGTYETTLKRLDGTPQTVINYINQIKLRLREANTCVLEELLHRIEEARPLIKPIWRAKPKRGARKRMLEVSLFDIHFGLRCYAPAADGDWTPDSAREMTLDILEKLLTDAEAEGPYEYILLPLGNDFYHCDNVFHTTTAGTPQPEADAWHHTYLIGEAFAVEMIERCKQVAPVKILMVPGNHARQSEYTLGRYLWAYYRNDANVEVDASSSPYKFEHYGVNLIGFEHGHSIRQQVRLAALMANECRDVWGETVYREWHLGDQHRKGSSKPSVHEEQGVSVEFLPGLVMPNEWHRLKSYNWQKRAGLAFVWDKEAGPVMRLQVNVNAYNHQLMR